MVKEILLLSYYLLISDKDLVNFRFNDSAQSSLSIFAQKYGSVVVKCKKNLHFEV